MLLVNRVTLGRSLSSSEHGCFLGEGPLGEGLEEAEVWRALCTLPDLRQRLDEGLLFIVVIKSWRRQSKSTDEEGVEHFLPLCLSFPCCKVKKKSFTEIMSQKATGVNCMLTS